MISVLLLDRQTVTVIDIGDLPLLGRHRWSPRRHGRNVYARAKINGSWVYLHRLVLDPPPGLVVDHIDGNSLNNTRANLRAVSQRENTWNVRPSEGRGISLRKGKWRARMWHEGHRLELGSYAAKEDAIKAYDTAVSILRDKFAFRNSTPSALLAISFPPKARKILLAQMELNGEKSGEGVRAMFTGE